MQKTSRRQRVIDFLKSCPNHQATFLDIFTFLYPEGKIKQQAALKRDLIQGMLADGDLQPVGAWYRLIQKQKSDRP